MEHPLAPVGLLVAVPQLEGLVDPCGGAAGDGGAVDSVGEEVDLNGRVPPAVDDLARLDILDGGLPGGLRGGRLGCGDRGGPDREVAGRSGEAGGRSEGGREEGVRGSGESHFKRSNSSQRRGDGLYTCGDLGLDESVIGRSKIAQRILSSSNSK